MFTALRRRARGLGITARDCGAVTFIQRFGSALQLNVHFHVLVAEGVFDEDGSLVPLPPPDDAEVQRMLELFLQRSRALFEARGLFELEELPQDALDALRLESAQWRLPLSRDGRSVRTGRRCAFLEGFRYDLETLCRYGARGALSLERLSLRADGRLAYRMKRPAPDGATHLVLTPLQLVKKLAALVPPPRFNLTRFHGVFAPNARLRKKVVPSPPPPTVAPCSKPDAPPAGPPPAPPEHTPSRDRLPWAELLRRSFAVDILSCNRCGGQRKVLAFISHLPTTRRILEHLLLPCGPPPLPLPASPPQLTFEPLESA